jgi:hypothetical protein
VFLIWRISAIKLSQPSAHAPETVILVQETSRRKIHVTISDSGTRLDLSFWSDMVSKRLTPSSEVGDDNEPKFAEKGDSIIKIYIPKFIFKFFLDKEDENFAKSISKFHKKRLQITNQTSTDFFEKSMNSALLLAFNYLTGNSCILRLHLPKRMIMI